MIQSIPFERLVRDPANVRKSFQAIEPLADSIAEHGLLQNLVVSPKGDGFFTVICGERRLRALGKLVERGDIEPGYLVPCEVVDTSDDYRLRLINLVENLAREEVPYWEMGAMLSELSDRGIDQKTLAKSIGVRQQHVSRLIRLYRLLHPAVIARLRKMGKHAPPQTRVANLCRRDFLDELERPIEAKQLDGLSHILNLGKWKYQKQETVQSRMREIQDMRITEDAKPYVDAVIAYLRQATNEFPFQLKEGA